jgi:hypothetical protein
MTDDDDPIDLDALDKYFQENPIHMSCEEELESVIEDAEETDPCVIEAIHLLGKWEGEPDTPLEQRRAELEWFYMKWNFVGNPRTPSQSQ